MEGFFSEHILERHSQNDNPLFFNKAKFIKSEVDIYNIINCQDFYFYEKGEGGGWGEGYINLNVPRLWAFTLDDR